MRVLADTIQTTMLPGGGDRSALEASEFRRPVIIACGANMMTEIPIGRLGRPEEIAETVMWMVKTGYVNNKVRHRHQLVKVWMLTWIVRSLL